MADIASRPALAPRVPWRAVGLALVLIALLVAAAVALVVGSRQTQRPAAVRARPRNGVIAVRRRRRHLHRRSRRPGSRPRSSPAAQEDVGTGVLARRDADRVRRRHRRRAEPGRRTSWSSAPTGRGPWSSPRTPDPGSTDVRFEWAPDSRSLIVDAPGETELDSRTSWRLAVRRDDAATPRRVVTGRHALLEPFRPPDGKQILINRHDGAGASSSSSSTSPRAQETVLADGRGRRARARPVVAGRVAGRLQRARRLTTGSRERLFVVNADGTGTTQITHAPGVWYDIDADWSPDGTQIAFTRYERRRSNVWLVRPTGIYDVATGEVTERRPACPRGAGAAAGRGRCDAPRTARDVPRVVAGRDVAARLRERGAADIPILIDVDDGHVADALDRSSASGTPTQQWQRQAP